MPYVYRHIRLDKNEPFYIGIGSSEYYNRAYRNKNRSNLWERIATKGKYEVEIMLDNLTWDEACEKEKEFISLYGRIDLKTGCLANMTNSTAGMKFWGKEHWQKLINWLVFEGGYEVYNVSLEPNPFDNCIQITTPSLESKMDWIAGSEFFVGLSSGLAWIAYALRKPVYMIANFTEEWNEFKCNRITNKNVCHGCWNNPNFRYAGEWDYCPIHKGTDRQWECQLSITADMVIEEIKKDSDGFEGYYAVFRNGSTKCHVNYLTPIELTEEWLLRFALIKDNGYPYKFLDGFIKMRNGEYFFKYHNLDIKLNYVHNLQNLHYIFTQTELTLKDEK